MALVVYSQSATKVVYTGDAPSAVNVHLTYDGTTFNFYVGGDRPLSANLVSALTQAGANITLTLPSSVSASIDSALFAQLVGQIVNKYYPIGAKDWPAGRTLGIALARLDVAGVATFLANL